MKLPFSDMPDDARLWVFAAPEPLDQTNEAWLGRHVDSFVGQWVAHGAPVAGSFEVRDHRFLFVAADEEATGVSGCSIDALSRTLGAAERELGVSLLDAASHVWYRDQEGEIHALPRSEFRRRAGAGDVTGDTPVFDNTVATVGALRRGEWEKPMRESWHQKAFGKA